jgi:hypothetical protein
MDAPCQNQSSGPPGGSASPLTHLCGCPVRIYRVEVLRRDGVTEVWFVPVHPVGNTAHCRQCAYPAAKAGDVRGPVARKKPAATNPALRLRWRP